jgi:hypothetical protein
VAEEGELVDVGAGEDVGAIVVGAAVVSAGVAGVLEADVGVEAVGLVAGVGLVLVAERLGEGVGGVELEIGEAVDEAGLKGVVVGSSDGDAGGDGSEAWIRPVIVGVGLGGPGNGGVGAVQAGIIEPLRRGEGLGLLLEALQAAELAVVALVAKLRSTELEKMCSAVSPA